WTLHDLPGTAPSGGEFAWLANCRGSRPLYLFRISNPTTTSSLLTSSDGASWSPVPVPSPGFSMLYPGEIRCLNGTLSSVGENGGYTTTQRYSPDGMTWNNYQPYSGYNPSAVYFVTTQTWDGAAGVYLAGAPVPASWNAGAANTYYRANTVGGAWSRVAIQ